VKFGGNALNRREIENFRKVLMDWGVGTERRNYQTNWVKKRPRIFWAEGRFYQTNCRMPGGLIFAVPKSLKNIFFFVISHLYSKN
jgi:hypothetical protein